MEKPDEIFTRREQKSEYEFWLHQHTTGFVLNWPRSGKASVPEYEKFHKAQCESFIKQGFPNHDWHKICDPKLSVLIDWAKDEKNRDRVFGTSPRQHACKKCFEDGEFDDIDLKERTHENLLVAVDAEVPGRSETTVQRIIRDTVLAMRVKSVHQWKCQLCSLVIQLPNGGFYAEAHHLKPLGRPHDGPDVGENIVCVCPTCHVMLDYGVANLDLASLKKIDGHSVSREFIDYHNTVVFGGRSAGAASWDFDNT